MKKLLTICLLITIFLRGNAQNTNYNLDTFFITLAEKPIDGKSSSNEIFVTYTESNYKIVDTKAESTMIFTKTIDKNTVNLTSVYTDTNNKAFNLEYIKENEYLHLKNMALYNPNGKLAWAGQNLYKGKGLSIMNQGLGNVIINQVIDGKEGKLYKMIKPLPEINFLVRQEDIAYEIYNGIMNSTGDFVVPLIYSYLKDFNNLYLAQVKGKLGEYEKYGVIDIKNNSIIPFEYSSIRIEKNIIIVEIKQGYGERSHWKIHNHKGSLISDQIFYFPQKFSEGMARVADNSENPNSIFGKSGFIDENGKVVIPIIYDEASDFENGKAKVKIGEREFYIDKTANEIKK